MPVTATALTRLHLAVLLGAVGVGAPSPAEAQLGDRIVRAARQKVQDRKERADDHVVQRATEPVDSTLERIVTPVDSAVGRAAGGASAVVGGIGRSRSADVEAEASRVRQALETTGRAELPGLTFAPGEAQPESSAGPHLRALARALAAAEGSYLIEGRPLEGDLEQADRKLGRLRAAAVKDALVAEGLNPARLIAIGQQGDGIGAAITVTRVE